MKVFVPRGIALNFNYFKNRLTGQIPYIYETINPGSWTSASGSFKYTVPNKLSSFGEIAFMTYFESNKGEVHCYLEETPQSVIMHTNVNPVEPVTLIGLPLSHVTSEEVLLTYSDFDATGAAGVSPSSNNHFMATVIAVNTTTGEETPAYFYTEVYQFQWGSPLAIRFYSEYSYVSGKTTYRIPPEINLKVTLYSVP